MLTLNAPHLLPLIREYPGGLCDIEIDGRKCLVIKAPKESLLATQINMSFKIYVVPIPFTNGTTIGLLTAFFDDDDNPLKISTPIFGDDPMAQNLIEMLYGDELDIYFFDEHSREFMSYRCELSDGGSLLVSGDEIRLLPSDPVMGLKMLHIVQHWFGLRTPEDDAKAITVTLTEELWPSDIAIMDLMDDSNDYVGSKGHSMSMLVREDPGYFQERDIVGLLKRSLDGQQVILNPRRRATKKEFADVVAGTERAFIIVQAKDSPNTQAALARPLERKIRTSNAQIEKALKQAKGALDHAQEAEPIALWLSEEQEDLGLYVDGRTIISLVIVKEVFPMQAPAILKAMAEWRARGDALLVLDYIGFHTLTHEFSTEERLVDALLDLISEQLEKGALVNPSDFAIRAFSERWNG